jgi:TRAP-type C4-dicarboxylate transport system permease small subunit
MIRAWFGWLYDVALLRVELAFTGLLLANVVVLSLVLILARNFQLPIWDPSSLSRIIFASAFLACLYGGCLATRARRQIAIDALSSYLPGPTRRRVEGFTSAVAALASGALYVHALRYLNLMVDPLASLAPGSDALLLREWVWKLPIAGAFGLIALHFAVRSARAFLASDDAVEGESGGREELEAGPPV